MTADVTTRVSARRWAAGLAVGAAVDVAFDPVQRHVPLCPFHALTGLWCPLCGGLRATYELAHGRLGSALHDNVLLVAALPLVLWLLIAGVPPVLRTRRAAALGVAVLVVFTVLRNLPGLQGLRPT